MEYTVILRRGAGHAFPYLDTNEYDLAMAIRERLSVECETLGSGIKAEVWSKTSGRIA